MVSAEAVAVIAVETVEDSVEVAVAIAADSVVAVVAIAVETVAETVGNLLNQKLARGPSQEGLFFATIIR